MQEIVYFAEKMSSATLITFLHYLSDLKHNINVSDFSFDLEVCVS